MAYVVWTVSKSRTWHIWSVLVDLRWFWSATQNKLPCGVIFSLNVSWNALFQFEIIFKIYEWRWWSFVVHFHLVSRIYNLELAFNDQCVCVWMATLSVFSGSGPLGQQFLMICSSWPGKHPLTFFPLVFILFFFSPRVQDSSDTAVYILRSSFRCDPETSRRETCVLLSVTLIRSRRVIFVTTLNQRQKGSGHSPSRHIWY